MKKLKNQNLFMKIFLLNLILILFFTNVFSVLTCPFDKINDSYPGDCSLYVDKNNDKICDYSQENLIYSNLEEDENLQMTTEIHDLISGKELKTKTVKEVANIYEIDAQKFALELTNVYEIKIDIDDSFQVLNHYYNIEPNIAKEIALMIKYNENNISIQKNIQIDNENEAVVINNKKYNLIPISLFVIIMYSFTFILYKIKKINIVLHRRIWNLVLLVSFLISAILGILLVIMINFLIKFPFSFDILYWHVEIGIIMTVVSIFHIFWHLSYFKNMFKNNNKK